MQFGHSVMPGGSKKQKEAREEGKPFKLAAWEHPVGRDFYDTYVVEMLEAAWELMAAHYPKACAAMLEAVPPQYRLGKTGFTKATLAWNNPVCSRSLPPHTHSCSQHVLYTHTCAQLTLAPCAAPCARRRRSTTTTRTSA